MSPDAVTRGIAVGLDALRARRLSAPAEAAFRHAYARRSDHSDAHNIDALAPLAKDVLEALAGGANRVEQELERLAVRLAQTAVREKEARDAFTALTAEVASLHVSLPADDRRRLEEFLVFRAATNRLDTLDSLLMMWERSVRSTETDADSWTPEEHTNALDGRDVLEQALVTLAPPTREKLAPHVRGTDARFIAATVDAPAGVGDDHWRPRAWWWYRIPA